MGLPDPDRSRIALLGSSKYADEEHLPPIPVVGQTVDDLRAAFTDPHHGIVRSEHCTVLLDEPSLPALGRKLRAAIADAEDLLLVYFVGHGLVGGRRHELYLGMYESEWDNPRFGSLPYETLREVMLDSRATTKVLMLDCCFSGRAVGEGLADKMSAVVGQLDVDGTYVLTSAHRDQVALVRPDEEYTAFTGRLLRVLRNGVPDGPELLTIGDLYRQLLAIMKSEGLSEPQKRGTRTADALAIARNRAFIPVVASALRQRYAAAVARAQHSDGKWPAVVAELRAVFAEQVRVLGDRHEDTLRAGQFLAHATGATGDPKEAVRLLELLLAEQLAAIGPDHPDTLQTRQFLAVNLGEAGQRHEAIAMLRPLLPDRRRVLGADDEATGRTQHVLARYLAMTGMFDEAAALLRELLAVRERKHGPEHPDSLLVRADLDVTISRMAASKGVP